MKGFISKIKELNMTPTGCVRGILQTNWRNFCGEIQQYVEKENGFVLVRPVDSRFPFAIIKLQNPES